jgi:hypothetical protein
MIVDDIAPREPGTLTGLAFFGATAEDVERDAKAYLGLSELVNRAQLLQLAFPVCQILSAGSSPRAPGTRDASFLQDSRQAQERQPLVHLVANRFR